MDLEEKRSCANEKLEFADIIIALRRFGSELTRDVEKILQFYLPGVQFRGTTVLEI